MMLTSQRLIALCLAAAAAAIQARADANLTQQIEELRSSLPPGDLQRRALGLRLADLYFDDAGELARHLDPTDAQKLQITSDRKRAAEFYQEALSGGNGMYAPVPGTLKTKVQ